ncbi:MAG: creatininase family protein [Thermoplasmata archaeon]|nr:creatininase family protein [Thermoplasmata archaeon]
MSSKFAKEMTREAFASKMKEDPVVILPIGCMEEHGDHLPIGTDTYEIEFVVDRISEKLNVIVLPTINYGNCSSTYNFPGTISISFDTLRALIKEILAEIIRHGAKKILVISGHAGNNHIAAIRMAVQETVSAHPKIKFMVLSDYDLVPEYKGGHIPSWDGHAGKAETSRMLNIRPDISSKGKISTRPKRKEFMIIPDPEKLFPSGISGDPRHASAELGKRIDDFVLRRLLRLINENFGSDSG